MQGVMVRTELVREDVMVADQGKELGIHSNMVRTRAAVGVLVGGGAC